MELLAIGDVVSENGCAFLRKKLSLIKKTYNIDFCIANGENSATGNGITPYSADYLFDSGVDFITTGNHVFRRKEIYDYLDDKQNIIRPYNYYSNNPGSGYAVVDLGHTTIGIANISGSAYMDKSSNPFTAADEIFEKIKDCRIRILDFHAEATAEKCAMGHYLDGRFSVVFGTHTHVQTSDATVLTNGTGYITDLGMTGAIDSVLGIDKNISINWLKTGMPARFSEAGGPCKMDACLFSIDDKTGKCTHAESLSIE